MGIVPDKIGGRIQKFSAAKDIQNNEMMDFYFYIIISEAAFSILSRLRIGSEIDKEQTKNNFVLIFYYRNVKDPEVLDKQEGGDGKSLWLFNTLSQSWGSWGK